MNTELAVRPRPPPHLFASASILVSWSEVQFLEAFEFTADEPD